MKINKSYKSLLIILSLLIFITASSCEYCLIPCLTPIPYGLGGKKEILETKKNKAGGLEESLIKSYSYVKGYHPSTPDGPRSTALFNNKSIYILDKEKHKYNLDFLQNDNNFTSVLLFKSVKNSEYWLCIQYTYATKKLDFIFFNKYKVINKNSQKPFFIFNDGNNSFNNRFQFTDQNDYVEYIDYFGNIYCYLPYENKFKAINGKEKLFIKKDKINLNSSSKYKKYIDNDQILYKNDLLLTVTGSDKYCLVNNYSDCPTSCSLVSIIPAGHPIKFIRFYENIYTSIKDNSVLIKFKFCEGIVNIDNSAYNFVYQIKNFYYILPWDEYWSEENVRQRQGKCINPSKSSIKPIGIGFPTTEEPSHTTRRTDRVPLRFG